MAHYSPYTRLKLPRYSMKV